MSDTPRGDVAIIGMSCIYPGAGNVQQFWENIIHKVDAISDPPDDWETGNYYDPDADTNDRTYCKRGGYLGKLAQFNPVEYGIMPNAVDGAVPDHFLALRVAREALADAGYADPARLNPVKARTAVILGHGGYINRGHSTMIQHMIIVDSVIRICKQLHPEYTPEDLAALKKEIKANLPPLHPEIAPGLVPNMISGRIANRLDLMGPSYTVDGACASSLLAVDIAMRNLLTGQCDMAIAGGAHCGSTPPIVIAFSILKALSRKGVIRPFDSQADGTLLSEGVGMLVLKRLEDAERHEDKIYALLKGVGTASDGRAVGLMAPRLEGEELALRRAYEAAALDPSTVELLEGHGTATLVGDAVELEALNHMFGTRHSDLPRCALGSVKSMIGHSIPASGLASIIKMSLALQHKVLPPTLHCDDPNPKLQPGTSNLYINTETRPWIHGCQRYPRRAGVNAFGFGGINAHAVLEEYTGPERAPNLQHQWDSELFLISAETRAELVQEIERLRDYAADSAHEFTLKDLAWSTNCTRPMGASRLAVIATSPQDLVEKLGRAAARLADAATMRVRDMEGIYYFAKPLANDGGKVAMVFPGEGAQYLNMLADLCVHFPEVRHPFDVMDRAFDEHPRGYLPSEIIVPPPMQPPSERLWSMDVGTEAVFAANIALFTLLEKLGVHADAMVGHSTGENSALPCSGTMLLSGDAELIERVQVLNRVFEKLRDSNRIVEFALVAVGGVPPKQLWQMAEQSAGQLHVALDNCPNQVVLCGTEAAINRAMESLVGSAAVCRRLPFSRAYHTPWFGKFSEMLRDYLRGVRISTPKIPLYTCVHADLFPDDPEQIREIASSGWSRTVRFRETIEKMYRDGMRIFVEVGPGANLTSFIGDVLRGTPHLAVASNVQHRSGILQLHHLLGQLAAHGVRVDLAHLYARRAPRLPAPTVESPSTVRLSMGMQPLRLSPGFSLPSARTPVSALAPERIPKSSPASPPSAPATTVWANEAYPNVPSGHDSQGGVSVTASSASGRAAVMQQHFATMQQFLAAQQQVFGALFASRSGAVPPMQVEGPAAPVSPIPVRNAPSWNPPFVFEMIEMVPGVRARMCHRFSMEPLFEHHALGFDVSAENPSMVGFSVVPLTVSVEIMAEAACVLEPGRVVVGMRNVRSQRWIMLDAPGPTIELSLERTAPGVIDVKIREGDTDKPIRAVWIEGTVLLADQYPAPQAPLPFALVHEKSSRWQPGTLYPQGMFHGPLMQGVKSVNRTGDNGATATLEILSFRPLLRHSPEPAFVLDPLCLDAAGQLLSFWCQEHVDQVCDTFPYRFDALECYSPLPPAGTKVEGRILINQVGSREIRCHLEVLDLSGRLLFRIRNWEDRCFLQSADLWNYRVCPRSAMLSRPADDWITDPQARESVSCCHLDRFAPGFLESSFGVWLKMLAMLSLGPQERQVWSAIKGVEKRRIDWLLGRMAAKDAVRTLIKRHFGESLYPADIEILSDSAGRPQVGGAWTERLRIRPVVSISHNSGAAAAIAALSTSHLVGIDIESLIPPRGTFADLAFTAEERDLVATLPDDQHAEWYLRLWCAKEALGKALGHGLSQGLHSMQILKIETTTGRIQLSLCNGLSQTFPHLRDQPLTVQTSREGNVVCSAFVHSPGIHP